MNSIKINNRQVSMKSVKQKGTLSYVAARRDIYLPLLPQTNHTFVMAYTSLRPSFPLSLTIN